MFLNRQIAFMLTALRRVPRIVCCWLGGLLFFSASAMAQIVGGAPYANDIELVSYAPVSPTRAAGTWDYTAVLRNNGPTAVTAADAVGIVISYSSLNMNEFFSEPPEWACGVVDDTPPTVVPITIPPTHAFKRCVYLGPPIPPGGTFPPLTLRVQSTDPSATVFTTRACAGQTNGPGFLGGRSDIQLRPDPVPGNDCASATVVAPGLVVDLSVAKRAVAGAVPALPAALPAAVASVSVGVPFNWVIDVANAGPGDSLSSIRTAPSPVSGLGTVVTDTLPAGVIVTGPITWAKVGTSTVGGTSVGSGTCTQTGVTVRCELGDLTTTANGGQARITIPVRYDTLPAPGPVTPPQTNTATVSSERPDLVPANNTATSAVTVSATRITGTVYIDTANNGTLAGNALRIAGVVVGLRTGGTGCADGTLLGTTVTEADGTYAFPGGSVAASAVTAGTVYRICQTQPASFADGTTNPGAGNTSPAPNAILTAALPAGGSAGNDFGELRPPSTITGLVYIDRARSGVLSPANPGRIPGVTIELRTGATSCTTGVVLGTTTTATDGSFAFPGGTVTAPQVTAGTDYLVCQAQPAAYADGTTNPGAGNTSTVPNAIAIAALPPGGSTGNLFGELAGRIAGVVYEDFGAATPALRDNGVRDAGELGIPNVPVTLTNTGTGATVVGATTADGSYAFEDLPAGTYTVTEGLIPPASGRYSQGRTTVGTIAAVAIGTAGVDTITGIVLPAGGAGVAYNFGELPPPTTISGLVYIDRTRTGVLGSNPGRIPGVTLELRTGTTTCGAGTLLGTTVTAADGSYAFPGGSVTALQVIAGADYLICQVQPTAYADGTANPGAGNTSSAPNAILVTALPVGGSTANQFGELGGRLSGVVYEDFGTGVTGQRDNGLRDTGERGIVNVPVTLAGAGLTLSTVTAADGSYAFDDLPAGTYVVTEGAIPPASGSYSQGRTTVGTIAAAAVGATGVDTITGIALPAGGIGIAYNFGELPPPPSISGLVYIDQARSGVLSAANTGRIPGVTIELRTGGTDCSTGTLLGTTVTAADGTYRFPGGSVTQAQVSTGTGYRICQRQPTAFGDGTTNPGAGNTSPSPNSILIASLLDAGSTNNDFGEVVISPDLVITTAVASVPLTETGTGRYTVTVGNAGAVPSSGTITAVTTLPPGLTLVPSTTAAPNPRGNGWTCTVAGATVTCTSTEVIAAGATSPNPITIDVQVASNVCPGGVYPCDLTIRTSVTGGGEQAPQAPTPDQLANPPLCTATATQNSCRLATPVQQPGGVSGLAWFDGDTDRVFSPGGTADRRLPGIVVELLRGGTVIRTTTTNAQGEYLITGLLPGDGYEIRFRDPVTGAYYGRPVSNDPAGGNDPTATGPTGVVPAGSIRNITIPGGNAVRINQNLPLDPNGVVYDSSTRQPVAGAVVELLGPGGLPLAPACVLGGVNRLTTAGPGTASPVPGGYAFWLVAPSPAGCPGDGEYRLRVTPPAGYLNAGTPSDGTPTSTSVVIPAQPGALRVPANCTGFAAGQPCTVQAQPTAPAVGQPTPYYFNLPLTPNTPATFVDIVNNHIPLDPLLGARFAITKQAGRTTAEVGDLVPYTITVRSIQGPALPGVRVDDRLPAGFRYIPGSFRIGGVLQADPAGVPGPLLRFPIGTVPAGGSVSFTYALRVGVGSQQGDGVNRAQAVSTIGATAQTSNTAEARVRVTGGVFSNETCVTGKVYVDCNHNQVQDPEELGVPGVRVVLQDGTGRISDSEGKYSFCGLPPRTHVLKADPLTLPRGSRLVTSSNRNAGDANSIFIDAKNGELQRADFIEGSCSNTVLEQVKARRTQGEVRAPETEKRGAPALKFEGKPATAPQQATDSANQPIVRPREVSPNPSAPVIPSESEKNVPVPALPAASPNTQRPPPNPPTPPSTGGAASGQPR
jgi:large repetitive protein